MRRVVKLSAYVDIQEVLSGLNQIRYCLPIRQSRSGKTGGTARQYVDRIFGVHPVPWKNVVYYECKKNAVERKEADDRREPLPERHQGGYYGAGYLPDPLTV